MSAIDQKDPLVEKVDVKPVNHKENGSLYKKRTKIHPKRVNGTFRSLKWWVMIVTLSVYYITPWIRWDRGPGAPDQAVLIDFPARRFYFFFIELWPQEIYYIAGLLIMAGIGLFFITSLFGRAWCGYACPQTVWTDLFIYVERWVEGDRAARIRLDNAPFGLSKAIKRTTKVVIWLIISVLTGGAWVFYYADAPTLALELMTMDAAPIAYTTIAVLSFTTFSLGALMREQVCIYMCPWPRIQGGMMDEDSLVVTYRKDRGEPRAPYKKGDIWEGRGDCVDCNQCVVVCPTGIDIRDGQQFECITCALCIDACNGVMAKVGRPSGLIGYASLAGENSRRRGEVSGVRLFRLRTFIYLLAIGVVGSVMLVALLNRTNLDISILHDRNPLYVPLSNGHVRNGYTFKILNKSPKQRTFMLSIGGLAGARLKVVGSEDIGETATPYFTVKPDSLHSFRLFVSAPGEILKGNATDIRFVLKDLNSNNSAKSDTVFRGPEK